MKKLRWIITLLWSFFLTFGVWAQDGKSIDDIKDELVELKKIMEAQSKKIDRIEGLLRQMEARPSARNLTPPVTDNPEMLSVKKKRLEIGGELELEFKTSEIDRRPDAVDLFNGSYRQTFDMDKADIYMKVVWNYGFFMK